MKTVKITTIIASMTLLASLSGFCQSYQKMIHSDKVWTIVDWQSIMEPPGITYNTLYARISNDTIINSNTYKKIVYSNNKQFAELNWRVHFVREDTILQKVYVYDIYEKKEILRYDFLINVLDNVQIDPSFICPGGDQIVESIDTLLIDGKKHRKYSFQSSVWDNVWIEGIGSMTHIVETPCLLDGGYHFLCLDIGGEKMYVNPTYDTCYMETSTISNIVNHKQPNRDYKIIHADDNISVRFDNNIQRDYHIELYTISGTLINRVSSAYSINTNGLQAGVYILRIYTKDNMISSDKIIIN